MPRARPSLFALLAAAALAAPALLPAPALAQAATSRGLPGGDGGVTVRRGLQTEEGAGAEARRGPGTGLSAPGALLNIEAVSPCVLSARPDMSKAILCYQPLLEACEEAGDRPACQRRAEREWAALARRYGDQPMTKMLAGAFDPAACETFPAPGLPREEGKVECRITAFASRAIYGHVESLWGTLGGALRP